MNALEALRTYTTIAADTADFNAIRAYEVTDATTNPTIILQTATSLQYQHLLEKAVQHGSRSGKSIKDKIEDAMDMIIVELGKNILEVIPGRVHIQIDTRLAFDTAASVSRALKLVQMFASESIPKERLVVKLPATWEGIQAAGILQKDHSIDCNLTTMFSLVQAAAGAEASVYCVAPFVGRIRQWYIEEKKGQLKNHPGVDIWSKIFNYMKEFSYDTKVMGAYFVECEEVTASRSDYVTVPIALLKELTEGVSQEKKTSQLSDLPLKPLQLTEAKFRWLMNEDEMATSLLSETIRRFAADCEKLEAIVKNMLLY